jgi:O-antigen/teichoic acid export membrane protein
VSREAQWTFFKQSGWMVIATTLSGVFLVAVYPILVRLPPEEFPIYFSLLRLFTVLALAAAGLQIVMAQDAAAAVTPEGKEQLAATVRAVGKAVLIFWLLVLCICIPLREQIIASLKISRPAALWVTMGLVLAQLLLPFAQGLLQGTQNFAWLGWSILLNGLGRFVALAVAVLIFKGHSTGALFGAFLGLAAAVVVGLWPSRHLFRRTSGKFEWLPWLKRVLPLSAGTSALLFMINADMLFVQSHFAENQARYYAAVAMVGVGLVTFTTPMASVMFPKLVSSRAKGLRSDSFILALSGTAILGLLGAVTCTLFPALPLRIMYFNKPDLWLSAQLVPWFMWCMLPVTLANVLITDLLAKRHYKVVFWLVLAAIGYGFSINHYLGNAPRADHFTAFKGVILRLGMFSSFILMVSAVFSYRARKEDAMNNAARATPV